MPELPEVEITARLIGAAISGVAVESALAPGINALKTFDPPLSSVDGRRFESVGRRGKLFLARLEGDLTLMVHLMSAGRLQLFDARASLRDRTSRLLVRLEDGRELRLREFGTRQRAWVKVLRSGEVETEETIAALGWTSRGPSTRCCATST
jgi:formamidopyrimidine-DNA glycosylase